MSATAASGRVRVEVEADLSFRVQGPGGLLGTGALPVRPRRLLVSEHGALVLVGQFKNESSRHAIRILGPNAEPRADIAVTELFPAFFGHQRQPLSGRAREPSHLGHRSRPNWHADLWIDDVAGTLGLISDGRGMGDAGVGPAYREMVSEPGSLPQVTVRSLQDGNPVAPWPSLLRRLLHPTASSVAWAFVRAPGAIAVPAELLPELAASKDPTTRGFALYLSVLSAPQGDDILRDGLSDCAVGGTHRTRAAASLLESGDDRGAPLLLMAAGLPRGKALAGRSGAGLCLKGLGDPACAALAAPSLPALLGSNADQWLLRIAELEERAPRPAAHAAVSLLLDRGTRTPAVVTELERFARCEDCDPTLRARALGAVMAESPTRAAQLLEEVDSGRRRFEIRHGALDFLAALGPDGTDALLRLLREDDPEFVGGVARRLLSNSVDDGTVAAVGDRLLSFEPGPRRQTLLRNIQSGRDQQIPPGLVPTLDRVVDEALGEGEASHALTLLRRGGAVGYAALMVRAARGRWAVEAARVANPINGGMIDACTAALRRDDLIPRERGRLASRIRAVVSEGLAEPVEASVADIAELFAAEPESSHRRMEAEALVAAGAPGRRALAGLLLRFPDDESDQAKQICLALVWAFAHDPPEEFQASPGSGLTRDPVLWRTWAKRTIDTL